MAGLTHRVRGNGRSLVVVVALLVLVNLPLLHGAWVARQVERHGVEVTAEVEATRKAGDGGLVEFRYDQRIDPDQQRWTAAVDARTLEAAEATDLLAVRVVPGSPSRYEVAGEQQARLLQGLTVFADLVLVLALVVLLRRRDGAGEPGGAAGAGGDESVDDPHG